MNFVKAKEGSGGGLGDKRYSEDWVLKNPGFLLNFVIEAIQTVGVLKKLFLRIIIPALCVYMIVTRVEIYRDGIKSMFFIIA